MQNQNPFMLLAVVAAIVLGSAGLYVAESKRSCECPRPSIHDDGNFDQPRRRPRRPDGSTGEVGATKTECPNGQCPALPKDKNGIVKRDM